MFNMKLLTLASLLIPTALTTPISHPSDDIVTTATSPAARLALPRFPYPPGYLAPRAAAAALPTTGPTTSTGPTAQLTTHHLPDCLASDTQVSQYTLSPGPCYSVPTSFLSYTARMAGPLPAAADGTTEACKVHVYSSGDCSGFESASAVTEAGGKCTETKLKVAYPGLAGVGAVGARVVCA